MIFTVGHSTLAEDKFVEMLRRREVDVLMDIRSHPQSHWPQFWREAMSRYLPAAGIQYDWEPRLGGWTRRHVERWQPVVASYGVDLSPYAASRFPKHAIAPEIPVDPERPSWTNLGLYVYSWFTILPEFNAAGYELIERAKTQNIAICCSEGAWFRCHRSLVADWLVWAGSDCVHLPGRKPHSATLGNRLERYHPDIPKAWEALRDAAADVE